MQVGLRKDCPKNTLPKRSQTCTATAARPAYSDQQYYRLSTVPCCESNYGMDYVVLHKFACQDF